MVRFVIERKMKEEGLVIMQKFYTEKGHRSGYVIKPEGRIITLEIKITIFGILLLEIFEEIKIKIKIIFFRQFNLIFRTFFQKAMINIRNFIYLLNFGENDIS